MSTENPLSVSNLLGDTFRSFGRNVVRHFALGLVALAPIAVLALTAADYASWLSDPQNGPLLVIVSVLVTAATVWWVIWLMRISALMLTIRNDAGAKLSAARAFRLAMRKLPALLVVGFLRAFLTMFGLLLFVVPGIVVAVATSMAESIVLAEDKDPVDALRRSVRLMGDWRFARLIAARAVLSLLLFLSGMVAIVATLGLGADPLALQTVHNVALFVAPLDTILVGIAYRRCAAAAGS